MCQHLADVERGVRTYNILENILPSYKILWTMKPCIFYSELHQCVLDGTYCTNKFWCFRKAVPFPRNCSYVCSYLIKYIKSKISNFSQYKP